MRAQPTIAVGILAEPEIRFTLSGDFQAGGNPFSSGNYLALVSEKGIKVSNEKRDSFFVLETEFNPQGKTCFFELKDVTIGIRFHWEQKENQQFKGSLKLIREGGNVRAVNLVPTEEYLKSVISSEMSAACSPELLKAHAVISRSWLLAQIEKARTKQGGDFCCTSLETGDEIIRWYGRNDHRLFDVCADDHCQRYQGITKILSGKVREAVEKTCGEVLVSEGQICDARFSKCCGGITENFENTWEPEPHSYLAKTFDYSTLPDGSFPDLSGEANAVKWILDSPPAFCNTSDKQILSQVLPGFDQATTDFFRWKIEYSQQQLSELIKKKSGFDFGEIVRLEPLQRGYSGRIVRLRITGTKKTIIVGKELEIRKWLSESHLYSSAFVAAHLNPENGIPQKFVLSGAGWGHGVGLCQIGAAVMGEKGYSYREILNHYFKGAEIKKIYS